MCASGKRRIGVGVVENEVANGGVGGIGIRGVLERLQRAVQRDLLALRVDFTGKCLDCRRLAGLARSVDDEIHLLVDETANLRHSVECRKHVVLGWEARSRDVEVFFHE